MKETGQFNLGICLILVLSFNYVDLVEYDSVKENDAFKKVKDDSRHSNTVVVSTIDGNFNAFDSETGKKLWGFKVKPLFESTLSDLQIIAHGKPIRLIPSLDGNIYKFDGTKIEKVSMNIESLLAGSYKLGDDLYAMAKRESHIFGICIKTGKVMYMCAADGCTQFSSVKSTENILVITTVTNEVRVIQAKDGSTMWHYRGTTASATMEETSNYKLISQSTYREEKTSTPSVEVGNINVMMAESLIEVEDSDKWVWSQKMSAPITDVWLVTEGNVKNIDIISQNSLNENKKAFKAALFLGVYNSKLYVKASTSVNDTLQKNKVGYPTYIPVETDAYKFEENTLIENNVIKIPRNGIVFYDPLAYTDENSSSCKAVAASNLSEQCFFEIMFIPLCFGSYFILMEIIAISVVVIIYLEILQKYFWRSWIVRLKSNHNQVHVLKDNGKPVPVSSEKSEIADSSFSSRFLQDFVPCSCLGVGGFGVVFECANKIDDGIYAIKRTALKRRPKLAQKLKREVTALAKLNHPHIVRYYTSWIEEPPLGWQEDKDEHWTKNLPGFSSEFSVWSTSEPSCDYVYPLDLNRSILKTYLYIQMELCKKESLADWLSQNLTRNKQEIFGYFQQIVSAVNCIHESGLIHRDLKPSNIFFATTGEIKVGDFGLVSQINENMPTTGDRNSKFPHTDDVGTSMYMSPEQLKCGDYNHKVDIYSLGLIFFEMLVPLNTTHGKTLVCYFFL